MTQNVVQQIITTRIWRSENWFRMPLQPFHYKFWISVRGKSQVVSMYTVVYGRADFRIKLINIFAFIYLYCKLGICKPCPGAPWHMTRLFFQSSWCAGHSTVKHDSYRGSEVALWPTDICDGTKQETLSLSRCCTSPVVSRPAVWINLVNNRTHLCSRTVFPSSHKRSKRAGIQQYTN